MVSMGKPKVLIISDITEENPLYANHFSQKFECIRYRPTTKEQYFEDIKSDKLRDINAVLVMWYAFIELGATLAKISSKHCHRQFKCLLLPPLDTTVMMSTSSLARNLY
ncbi:hypothetical protein V1508DRAFT_225185 [Lipomyces doorenjongii]|uniref:uncharacterized protein n=1 Tax=Lipomyces doorenjongii TaxID=383834 RepID=UPI0034CFB7E4